MRVLLIGDTHGRLPFVEQVIRWALARRVDLLFQMGDFGFVWPGHEDRFQSLNRLLREADLQLWWLDGNHENFDTLDDLDAVRGDFAVPMSSHITKVPRGFAWNWERLKVVALGGAVSVDRNSRVAHLSWWPQESITMLDAQKAAANQSCDILLCHDVPEGVGRIREFIEQYGVKSEAPSKANRELVRGVAEELHPRWIFHGHYHLAYQERIRLRNHEALVVGIGKDVDRVTYDTSFPWGVLLDIEGEEMRIIQ